MVNDSVAFTIKGIDRKSWDNLVNNIPRKFTNSNGEFERLSVERYFKELIVKISKLKREEIIDIINHKSKVGIIK